MGLTIRMKTATTVCGRCGAKFSGGATREVCPACLLESGLGLFDEELLAGVGLPAATPKVFGAAKAGSAKADDPGRDDGVPAPERKKTAQSAHHGESVLRRTKILSDFGDYEVLEEIGRGGQAVVYRAHQKSLNRDVALKVIGLGPWTTEAHLKRFRREAEAAASLDHPGIVPIYEVGEREGQCYFSMKFVEGGQLDELVKRTPMSIRQAVELIEKVARTVHYAHEHGILHRDIKPGNILLDQNGEPHLTDFGLARLVEAESTVTGTLEVLGTPSYMAPEQAAGKTTGLRKATDVYGLGAVLYQLLTGQPPFAEGTTYETIKLLLDTEPRQPRLLNPKIDRDLSTICLKCLEKNPTHRYSTALLLAEDLEHWLKHEPIQARRTGAFTRGRKWVRRNPTSTLLVASLVALAAAAGWIVWKTEFIPHPVTNGVAVLPFENLSGDPDEAYFADGIQEEILTRLGKIAALKVISRTSTQQYQSKPRNLGEIAKQLRVANILEGSVQKAADQVRVNVQLINAQTDSHLWAESYDRKLTDIFGVESDIAKRIADSLQAKLIGREEQALAVKPTNNPEAYDAYLRGLAFQARSDVHHYSPNAGAEATRFFEQAVQLDPNFAIAWARLSRADALRYFVGDDTTPTTRGDAAKRALENAQKLAPNSPETALAFGYYEYRVLGDYGSAKTAFDRVSKMLPSSSEAPHALGLIARRQRHWDESIAYYEQARALDPQNVDLLAGAAWNYVLLRQFLAALKLYDRMLDITPNDPDIIAAKARVYQAEGRLQEAGTLISGTNWLAPSISSEVLSDQLRLERRYGDAVQFLQTLLAQPHLTSQLKAGYQLDLALYQRLARDIAGAQVTAEQSRNILEQLLKDKPDDLFLTKQLSWAHALMGEKDLALKLADRAVTLPIARDALSREAFDENLALIEANCGGNSNAIATITHLLQTTYAGYWYQTPITPALLRLDPIWDPLRSDPAFQKLCQQKQ
jgi:TolB-like protein/predicted Ser/Thr protein kinase/Tfp pilus assembly protein PilF